MRKILFAALIITFSTTLASLYAVSSDPLSLGLSTLRSQNYRDADAETEASYRFTPMMDLFGKMINEQKQTVRSATTKAGSSRNNLLSTIAKLIPFGRRFI